MIKPNTKSLLVKVKFKTWLFNAGVVLMLVSFNGYSQTIVRQSISSYGATSSQEGLSYAQTIGQAYNTQNVKNSNVAQGFLQPVSYKIEKVVQVDFEALEVKVFPNPSQYRITLHSKSTLKEAYVVISNIQGNIIYDQKVQNLKEYNINCSSWAKGTYLIKIQDDNNKQSVSKLIISK
ncbi:T9SS type A sorting domain-containing protein [Flavobacteriaceae bacterium GSB9]|nr:T9SS type A sorting domain-containing protein [Flavobacteriaceae bacterium GSB9]